MQRYMTSFQNPLDASPSNHTNYNGSTINTVPINQTVNSSVDANQRFEIQERYLQRLIEKQEYMMRRKQELADLTFNNKESKNEAV